MRISSTELIIANRPTKPDRRRFIGGSDARIIMSPDEAALIRLWKEKRGEAEPEDLAITSSSSSASPPKRSIGLGMSAIQGAPSPTSSAGSGIRSIDSWRRPSTASSTTSTPCSRPSSCCPGRSRKRRRRKSTWPSSSTTCGSPTPAPPRSRSSPAAANGSK